MSGNVERYPGIQHYVLYIWKIPYKIIVAMPLAMQ